MRDAVANKFIVSVHSERCLTVHVLYSLATTDSALVPPSHYFQQRPDARYVDIEGLHEIATHPVTHVVLCSIKTDGEMGIDRGQQYRRPMPRGAYPHKNASEVEDGLDTYLEERRSCSEHEMTASVSKW